MSLLLKPARVRDVAMLSDLWLMLSKIDTPRLHSVRWRSAVDETIATWIVALTPPLIPVHQIKDFVNFGSVTRES